MMGQCGGNGQGSQDLKLTSAAEAANDFVSYGMTESRALPEPNRGRVSSESWSSFFST